MNRKARRAQAVLQSKMVELLPKELTILPQSEWPPLIGDQGHRLLSVWRSRQFLVQVWDETRKSPGLVRLSVNRTSVGNDGRYLDGISWDDLQKIKNTVGFADWWGYEVFPAAADVVNVANMRHLWLIPEPLPFRIYG